MDDAAVFVFVLVLLVVVFDDDAVLTCSPWH
jgi:hypothetical protein